MARLFSISFHQKIIINLYFSLTSLDVLCSQASKFYMVGMPCIGQLFVQSWIPATPVDFSTHCNEEDNSDWTETGCMETGHAGVHSCSH